MEAYEIIWIILGLLFIYYLYVMIPYWYRQGYKAKDMERSNTYKAPIIEQQTKLVQNKEENSKQKGDAFEKYIVSLFNSDSGKFRIKEWRSDKMAANGLYALSNHLPDLEMVFMDGRREYCFAIECKWRKEFQNGAIEWAKEYQIKNYLKFQKSNRIPVFVAIGIGGTPSQPDFLFLPKLDYIAAYSTLYESFLKQYNRNPNHKFFYNPQQRMLY
jgi:hypothetical protein